ncbi:hypothetical protein MMC11_005716 [Xylographa trunciseda]|nr:hypothetical protein [Xylographa trunciseda]
MLQKRARNDLRLKSRFESIFEKFGKDFTGVGDEIDLQTGKVVVNNGHLTTMQGELDAEGLANEEDELATDAPAKLGSSQQSSRNDDILTKSQEDEDNNVQAVQEGPYGPEVACIGSSIAAAMKMEDGSSYDSSVHGELFIARNILSQLSCLGPHIRKSIANIQRTANTSKVLSIETEDLTVDPVWRVPLLIRPKLSTPSAESSESQKSIPEQPPLASPERSPSPVGQSLWSLNTPPDRSSLQEKVRAKDCKSNRLSLGKGRRPPRWTVEEDAVLRNLKSTTKLTYQELETRFPGRTDKALEQRWYGMKPNFIGDSQFIPTKSSSPYETLPQIKEPELPVPIMESIIETASIQTSPVTNITAEISVSTVPLSMSISHNTRGVKKGNRRRAEHARRAYPKISSEKPSKHREGQHLDKRQADNPQASIKSTKISEEHLSPRVTERAGRTEIGSPAIIKKSSIDGRLTVASFEPISSRISKRTGTYKDTSQLPKVRRPKKTQGPVSPEVTASWCSNETPFIGDKLSKNSLVDIGSSNDLGNNRRLPDVRKPSSQDTKTNKNSRLETNEFQGKSFKEISVIIPQRDNSNDPTSPNVVCSQSSEVQPRSTHRDSPTPVSNPRARRGRPRKTIAASKPHNDPESLSMNNEVQPRPSPKIDSLPTEQGYIPWSQEAQSQERDNRDSNGDAPKRHPSSSPDLAAPSSRGNLRVPTSSKPVRKSISSRLRSNTMSAKRSTKPTSTADSPSLTSMLGYFSDDELSNIRVIGKILLTTTPLITPAVSAKARRCGLSGYRCDRALCLTCN